MATMRNAPHVMRTANGPKPTSIHSHPMPPQSRPPRERSHSSSGTPPTRGSLR
jgi:hypothetical protein